MKKTIKIILVILWMAIIFCFSNQKADDSSNLSDGLIVKVASIFVDKNLSTKDKEIILEKYTTIVRKTAHFSIYLILGILVISLLLEYNIKHIILVSLITCLLYSISDEVHQLFIEGRSGEVRDVLIDTTGSLVGIGAYYFISKKYKIVNKKD